MGPIRAAFVMEQTLGHVTHYRNLRSAVAKQGDVAPTWMPIPFEVNGLSRLVPVLRSNWSVRASWRARRALNGTLAAKRHDVVVFHTQVTALFSLAAMRRLPSVVSLDATPINYDSVGDYYGHRAAGDGMLDRQKYRMNQRVFQSAAGLVTWSEWARRSLIDDYGVDGSRTRVIPPGAAATYFDIGQRRHAQEARPGSKGRPARALFVGGDFRRKGGALLLDRMRGPLADRCELHVATADDVTPRRGVHIYRGLGPNSPELGRLFAEADMFVLPTFADCLAVVVMEAMAAGLPVITTGVGALGEMVRDGENGLLIRAGDGEALERALRALVENTQLRRRMGRVGYELACRSFDARHNGQALLDVVVEVAQAGHRARRAA
jgi:glycosyltransferase involved in cell wall biosynthesis